MQSAAQTRPAPAGDYADLPEPGRRASFHTFMAEWPTGLAVVTTEAGGRPLGCTAQSLMSVSLEPPQLVVSLAESSHTLAALLRSGSFGLNLLRAGQSELSDRFAVKPAEERFRDTAYASVHGVPILTDAAASMVCRLGDVWQRADHVLVIGLPVWQNVDSSAELLLRHRGGYRTLQPPA